MNCRSIVQLMVLLFGLDNRHASWSNPGYQFIQCDQASYSNGVRCRLLKSL
jgi:hypothetical protein